MAYYIETCAGPMLGGETARIRFEPNDEVVVLIGTQSTGQGHETAYAQVVAEALGLPFERITVRQGDSTDLPVGGGTGGSRSLMIGGMAMNRAAEDVIKKALPLASEKLEVAARDVEFRAGRFTVKGTDRSVGLGEIAAAARATLTRESDGKPGLEGSGRFDSEAATYPNGCHVCEVEIDSDTGALDVVRYTVVDDFGKVINPLLLAGQVHGGIAQGLGQALYEETVFDPGNGQLISGSFMDYCMPRADDFCRLDIEWREIPCRTNLMGIKGAGEAGAIGAPPAAVNAVVNALADLGVRHIDMPVTPSRLWRAINRPGGA